MMKKFNCLATISQFPGCFWYCYNTAAQECHVQNSLLNSITVECFSLRKSVCSMKQWCKKQIVLRHFYWKKETKTVISCDNKLVWFSFDSTWRRKLANMFPKIENLTIVHRKKLKLLEVEADLLISGVLEFDCSFKWIQYRLVLW